MSNSSHLKIFLWLFCHKTTTKIKKNNADQLISVISCSIVVGWDPEGMVQVGWALVEGASVGGVSEGRALVGWAPV